MAKAVRWQIPFVSTIDKIPYRIDIYDEEGDWSEVTTLQAGTSPFVTDEDDNTDYFSPIRIQTGIIQVCTKLPNGGMLMMDDILPENNISRPVRLVRTDTNTIQWQGFLNCEAYNQDYVGTPQIMNLAVNSVLEAMASVQLDTKRSIGLETTNKVLYNALNEIALQSGMTLFTHVNCSYDSLDIFNKLIDQTVFYEREEYNNENNTWYIISGISAKDVIERICKFMGWIAREQGTEMYLTSINAQFGSYKTTLYGFGNTLPWSEYIPNYTLDIINLKWRGTDHQKSIMQGAKSVGVEANLEKYQLNISLPEFPVGEVTTIYRQLWKYEVDENDKNWLYLVVSRNLAAYSNLQHAFYSADVRFVYNYFEGYETSALIPTINHMSVGIYSSILSAIEGDQLGLYKFYAGSFLCRYCWENTGDSVAHDTTDALYCIFFPGSIGVDSNFDTSKVGPIFTIDNVTHYTCSSGYLRLSASVDTIFVVSSEDYTGKELAHKTGSFGVWEIGVELQYGDKWWNGSNWQDTQCIFNAEMTGNDFKKNWVNTMNITETNGLLIPITEEMDGLILLKIWPIAGSTYGGDVALEMIFTSLNLDHLVPEKATETDRSANHYFRLLGTNFRNEVRVSTNLASYLNNEPSPSLIMQDPYIPAKKITYNRKSGVETMRPEVDLLNRLAEYYKLSRESLSLRVKHPDSPLALTHLNGINDGKVYTPIAESRDWKADVSTITCMEIPNEEITNNISEQ